MSGKPDKAAVLLSYLIDEWSWEIVNFQGAEGGHLTEKEYAMVESIRLSLGKAAQDMFSLAVSLRKRDRE